MASNEKIVEYYTKNTKLEDLIVHDVSTIPEVKPPAYSSLLDNIHEETQKHFYGGCIPLVSALEGLSVLDMGCSCGRDVYLYSQMVGENGKVTGMDITPSSIEAAKSTLDFHMKKFGYTKPNVEFVVGNIEDLSHFKDASVDFVVSNGAICVVPGFKDVIKEVYRILKPGGEFQNMDLYTNTETFEEMKKNEIMWAEGLAYALQWKNFVDECCNDGFVTPHLAYIHENKTREDKVRELLKSEELYQKFAKIKFAIMSYRTFKVDVTGSESGTVTYKGGIPFCEEEYIFDLNTTFKKGQPATVGPELVAILKQSRLSPFFTIEPAEGEITTKNPYRDPYQMLAQMST